MPVFFISSTAIQGNTITLSGSLHTHISKSLRVRTGAAIRVCDERRQRHSITVTEITKNVLIGEIQETVIGPPTNNSTITLAQSILRGEHMAWGIQKATELGIDKIAPLITQRVQSRSGNSQMKQHRERWQRIALEAAQQSERWDVPIILDPQPFQTFIHDQSAHDMNFILTERKGMGAYGISFEHTGPSTRNIVIAIGPEGGWTHKEVEEAEMAGFTRITLGEKILRSETAAIVGLTIIQQRLARLKFMGISDRSHSPV